MNKLLYEIYLTLTFNFFKKQLFFIYFLTVLGLCCCVDFFHSCRGRGCFLAARRPLLAAVSLLVWSIDARAPRPQQQWRAGSAAAAQSAPSTRDRPTLGTESVSPALAGRLSPTKQPRKSEDVDCRKKNQTY